MTDHELGGLSYSEADWQTSASHAPLSGLAADDLLRLHRHWIWADYQRARFDELLLDPEQLARMTGEGSLASQPIATMFVWYGLLYALIEGCLDPNEKRNLDLRGPFRADIDALQADLKLCRNASFHVPRDQYLDERYFLLAKDPANPGRTRRVTSGFARLFYEEFERRKQAAPVQPAPGPGAAGGEA